MQKAHSGVDYERELTERKGLDLDTIPVTLPLPAACHYDSGLGPMVYSNWINSIGFNL